MLVSKCNAAADNLRAVVDWIDKYSHVPTRDALRWRVVAAEKALRQAAGYIEEVDGPGEPLAFDGDVSAALDLLDSQRGPDDGTAVASPAPGA